MTSRHLDPDEVYWNKESTGVFELNYWAEGRKKEERNIICVYTLN